MLKDCTIFTFNDMETLRSYLDRIIENVIKISNNDCDGMSPQRMCDYVIEDLKEIRELLD